ncbi:CHAD domain-containing protein [Mucilaginibacter sp. BJC16-A38]|uniref:CHAD domain-containing protein n=1 Tax=Mucilaginibacter phenanthrenivorans TaxID=1234842 RepID=UPI0021581F08|nr:CHAD domain-containing protein [Mucilaginibacter phenanthrenivorans]MCR8557799.1 CHAD domain-containing protein [Mucilaginibacter phenanthrenivorans]
MKKKTAVKYFDREWKGMKSCLKSYLKIGEQEDLHKFRVQVKKLQALLILSDQTSHHAKLVPCFKPVKKVFKQAGELRNVYIAGELTQRRQPADKAAQSFRLLVDKHLKDIKKVRHELKTKLKSIRNKQIRLFYESQLRQIARDLAAQPSAEYLHTCRKRIKVLLYNYQAVRTVVAISLDTAYLNQVQETIGRWHDQILSVGLPDNDAAIIGQLEEQQCLLKAAIEALTNNFYLRATGH